MGGVSLCLRASEEEGMDQMGEEPCTLLPVLPSGDSDTPLILNLSVSNKTELYSEQK